MKFYLETVQPQEAAELNQALPLSGLCLNAFSLAEGKLPVEETIRSLLEATPDDQVIFVSLMAPGFHGMLKEARKLVAISQRLVPCVPANAQGLMALKAFKTFKITGAAEMVYTVPQAVFALANQASYVLMNMANMAKRVDPIPVVKELMEALSEEERSKIICLSVGDPSTFAKLAAAGVSSIGFDIGQGAGFLEFYESDMEFNVRQDTWINGYLRTTLFDEEAE